MYPCGLLVQSLNKKYYAGVVEDYMIFNGAKIDLVEKLIRENNWECYETEEDAWNSVWELHGKVGNVGLPKRVLPILKNVDGSINKDDLEIYLKLMDITNYNEGFTPFPLGLHRCFGCKCSICDLGLSFGNKWLLNNNNINYRISTL